MDQLRKDGWYINETQAAELFDNAVFPKTSQEILNTIINEDIRHFAEASIINLYKKDENTFDGPCVLQLLRYRNVSVPRIKEEFNQVDPVNSLIRIFLTDGHISISALILQSIPGIDACTPPGTKIQINGRVPVEGNVLILSKKDVKILGGRVADMIEKWNVEKSFVRADVFNSNAGKAIGAPRWVSFEKRGQRIVLEKGFKANSVMPKTQKEGDGDDDFSKNRAEVIQELGKECSKTFAKPNLAPPPVKASLPEFPKKKQESLSKAFKKNRGRNSEDGPHVDVGEYVNHKPCGPATLFDFIGGPQKDESYHVLNVTDKVRRMHVSEENEPRNMETRINNTGRSDGSRDEFKCNESGSLAAEQGVRNISKNNSYDSGRHGTRNFEIGTNSACKNDRNGKKIRNNTSDAGQRVRNVPQNNISDQCQKHTNQSRNKNRETLFQNSKKQYPNNPNRLDQQQNHHDAGQSFRHNSKFCTNYPKDQGGSDRVPTNSGMISRGSYDCQRKPKFQGTSLLQHCGNQHFQQGQQQLFGNSANHQWHVGAQCLATWIDGNVYPATVIELLPNRTARIRYNEYGNVQTIPVDFLIIP